MSSTNQVNGSFQPNPNDPTQGGSDTVDNKKIAAKLQGISAAMGSVNDQGTTGGQTSGGTENVSINGQVYVIDYIPFKAFLEQLKQRLEQTLTSIDIQKMQVASYIGDTVNQDGSVSTSSNGGIMGQICAAIIAGGDAQAQQTMNQSIQSLSQAGTQIAGGIFVEAAQGNSKKEQDTVDKTQNAIDALDKIPAQGTKDLDTQRRRNSNNEELSDEQSESLENAINDLKNGTLDFSKEETTFGSKIVPDQKNKTTIQKQTQAELEGDPTKVNGENDNSPTVYQTLLNSTPEERQQIKTALTKQLNKAKDKLDKKQETNRNTRESYRRIVEAAGMATGGGVTMLNAAATRQKASQDAAQTQAQSVESTAKSMMSTNDASTTDRRADIKSTLDALQSLIDAVNRRT